MLSKRTYGAAADELSAAATAVEHADSVGAIEALPDELEVLAEALRAAGQAVATSASRVVPAADSLDRGICSRYRRASANWPTVPPPSHERFAAALARLHDAAGAARSAARSCDEARWAVAALLRPSQRTGSP